MSRLTVFVTFALAAFLVVAVLLLFVPAVRRSSVAQLGRSVGLAVEPTIEAALRRRFVGRSIAMIVGAAAGLGLVGILYSTGVIATPAYTEDVETFWLLFGAFFGGGSIGAAVYALFAKPARPEGERFARSGAVGLADYLAPVDRLGTRVAVVLGVAALVLAVVLHALGLTATNPVLTIGGVIVIASVLALVLAEIANRRILDRPQPAGSPAELAWDDALRAASVREIVTAPLCLGAWGALAVLIRVSNDGAPGGFAGIVTFWIGMLGALLVFITIMAAAVVSIATKPPQHYLRRLWPDVAAAAAHAPASAAPASTSTETTR